LPFKCNLQRYNTVGLYIRCTPLAHSSKPPPGEPTLKSIKVKNILSKLAFKCSLYRYDTGQGPEATPAYNDDFCLESTHDDGFVEPPEGFVDEDGERGGKRGESLGGGDAAAAADAGATDALPEYTGGLKNKRLEELVGLYKLNSADP
jgi:hypothetical protein